jgi:putative ABC transport system permease protein
MISALHRKLLRDLLRLRGQVLTIALVFACGIASFVALHGNYASLEEARARFYDHQRFADVFAQLERAPETLHSRLELLPGVELVETRVVEPAMLPMGPGKQPVRARVVSLAGAGAKLNAIRLRDGRMPEPGRVDEAVLLQGFADAHGLVPGDVLETVLNGKEFRIRIVGTASSPEYVLAIGSGAMGADPERFAVLFMSRESVATTFRMEGAFNDVSLALAPGASEAAAIDALDRELLPYGGSGAYGRARQPSNHFLEGEMMQLASISKVLPIAFLGIAALLVNVVLSRLVHLEQSEIATLKAIGYSNARVGLHFLELVLLIGCLGAGLGVAAGGWLGARLVDQYGEFFKFPDLEFSIEARYAVIAVGVSFVAAATGAVSAVRRAVVLPPAEAMRPPSPARYRRSLVDRLGLTRLIGPSGHMILRELERRPLRAALSSVAIAMATALSVVGGWYYDGVEALVENQFLTVMREDAAVTFLQPRPERALRELAHVPGVTSVEGIRVVPVRFRNGHRQRDGALMGYPDDSELRQVRDLRGRSVGLPQDGVVLTHVLAEILEVRPGDSIEIEVREGRHDTRRLVVAGLVDEAFGLQGHMRLDSLRAWLGEQPLVSMALLQIDPSADADVDERLKQMPTIAEVMRRRYLLERFREQSGGMILTAAVVVALFAATITIGVVYNNARIALSMRGRDLASLRVLGYTRGEVSAVLLGELALQVLLAVPLGLVGGAWLVAALASTVDPETYRMPLLLTPRSYAFAALVTLVAALLSALAVRRRIDQLDLVAVLKTRE